MEMKKKIFKRIAGCVFLFAAALTVLPLETNAQSKRDIRKAKQLVEQADKAFRQKNYQAAVDLYSQSLVLVPKNAYGHFWKGYAHYYLKEHDPAIAEFDMALSQGYKPLDIYKVRWYLHSEKKNFDAALADIKEVVKLEPGNTDFTLAVAEISFLKGDYRGALGAYQQAVLKLPNNGDLFYHIARTQFNLGDFDAQAAAAEEAIKKRTQFLGESLFLLGDAREKQRRNSEAIEAYKRALASKPDTYAAYRKLAELYRSENRINEAIEISKSGLRMFPGDGNIYTDISWYYSLADRHEEAIQAALAGTKILPDQYMAYTNLCRAYNDTRKPELAIAACNSALRISKTDDGETNFYLGRAYALTGKNEEAMKYYRRAITGLLAFTASNPNYSDGFYLLGNAYSAAGQSDRALEAYKKTLTLSPRFAKARFNIGIIQINAKNKSGALEQYNSLLLLDKELAGKLKTEIDKL